MPQKHSLNLQTESTSTMGTFIKTVVVIVALLASFGGGYFTAKKGYQVTDASGASVVKVGNAAQTVKEENARLAREVVGKTEADAKDFLEKNQRTLFVGTKDGVVIDRTTPKVFTNLTVEVKDEKVVKVLGWY